MRRTITEAKVNIQIEKLQSKMFSVIATITTVLLLGLEVLPSQRTRDLNQAMNEDDEDLLRNVDSAEVDAPSDTAEGDDFGTIND
ncbi:hypothetical protein NC653_023437 [Populus alba x Populus x berolinensis]|uniref:Uncharacterized protein n=1 Tax=Populus alba x Populus x berolinensis TaxID=444605 RepID=A0AAD6MH73_9ROSI|nr:hypothetical protein NC653_023437 [Populus alba x Populus x berolinensis]